MVAGSVVIALGIAPAVTLGTDLVVSSVAPERAGVASGISETGAELGGALGIALLGSIGIAVYRGEIRDAIPSEVPAGAATTSEGTLGGATEAVIGLPADVGETLLDAAREAFTKGMQVAALAGAVVALVTAIVSGFFLWRTGRGSSDEEQFTPTAERAVKPVPC